MISIKSAREITILQECGKRLAHIISDMKPFICEGVNVLEIEQKSSFLFQKYQVEPAFQGYHGYPSPLCISLNNEVVHAIPRKRTLVKGDIVSIDIGARYLDLITDAAITIEVGKVTQRAHELVRTCDKALEKGISCASPGNTIGDIGEAIQTYVEKKGFSVVRDLVGHGVGHELHEDPAIPNYGKKGDGPTIEQGMVFAIEPMITVGSYEVDQLDDNWTIVTRDNSLAAHFEHTIVITSNGNKVLTTQ